MDDDIRSMPEGRYLIRYLSTSSSYDARKITWVVGIPLEHDVDESSPLWTAACGAASQQMYCQGLTNGRQICIILHLMHFQQASCTDGCARH